MTVKTPAERRLSAQHAVALALADSPALSDATPRILRAICQSLGWAHGALWEAAGDAGVLTCVETWHEPNLEEGLIWLANAGGDSDTNAAVAGGLLGARDGEPAIPARWIAALPEVERLRSLALRLVGEAA